MYYGTRPNGEQTGFFEYGVWDPTLGGTPGSYQLFPNLGGTDLFCSSQTLLPTSGQTLLAGGDQLGSSNLFNRNSNLFDYRTNTVTRTGDMWRERWYASPTVLMNGEVLLQGGSGGADRPEVRQTNGTFRLLSNVNTGGFHSEYPKNWVAPDGRVFGIEGGGQMYFIDTAAEGVLTAAGRLPATNAASVSAGAAMFQPGRILKLTNNSPSAAIVDIRRSVPVVSATEAASSVRYDGVTTILADGRVLATGGAAVRNQLATAVYSAEVWNPVTGEWTIGSSHRWARLYHGSALLLPDARVLLAGGGAPGPLINTNGEIYTPSYLYNPAGILAARPSITAAPTVLEPGQVFTLETAAPGTSRVTLVRTGSVTHSWTGDQRFSDLPFTADAAGTRLSVQLPSRATDTPPGFYMIFVFNGDGVPSTARIARMNQPGAREAAQPPTLADIADQNWTTGPVTLQPSGSSPRGATLRWTASGLPPGLTINPVTGVVSGTPTRAGTYFVTVSTDDTAYTATRSFTWQVTSQPFTLQEPVGSGPAAVNSDATFNATATGVGIEFSWNFGDGSAQTPFSTTRTATHRYTSPGIYSVTVTARTAAGLLQSRSIFQMVSLPLTARAAVSSSLLGWQRPATGNPRLWVANPDANTVSVFDSTTRAKLAEVAVGVQPSGVAIASDGRAWVPNRRSDSVSVIDPVSFAVVRTIAMPRGSQPSAAVADPVNNRMFISLEAAGRLLRVDATTFATTGDVAIGPDPRHLAIAGDGQTVYVSRFITPALPGESTALVSPNAGGVVRGGEVVGITASTMSVARTIVLSHSDRPDFENQGRGIPNYLGAMAISPDGTQAFVPSKQDNVLRGSLRSGQELNFQSTVRAISSRVVMATQTEDAESRIDHDNASLASAAVFDSRGVLLFVALETSRQVAILNAHNRAELFRLEVGLAPQSLALSGDGNVLYVHNFMSRTVGVYDISALVRGTSMTAPLLATLAPMANERLAPAVLKGKQLFYDAGDTRLARDRYMSCASCHNDGGHDGRTWDLTGLGEGLRNTPSLRGRGGTGHGALHWSANFNEVQDFEGQIRTLAGGTGLMTDAQFNTGTRRQPLGDNKAGISADLDALAAYVTSLSSFDRSPGRSPDGNLTASAAAGRTLFEQMTCASCHGGLPFTNSTITPTLSNAGTLKPASGNRLGAALTGIDAPTLRDVWATAPYLHDGSAPTVEAAISAHTGAGVPNASAIAALSAAQLTQLADYVRQLGSDEGVAPGTPVSVTPVNLALNRPASQSSTDWGAVASIAVDGVINGNATVGGVITHTFGNPNEWWQVDLGSAANLSSIVIWGRTDCCTDRLNGFNIMVSSSDMTGRSYSALVADPTVWKSPLVTSPITTNRSFTLPAGLTGRYVRVQMAGSNMLSMTELQVFGTTGAASPNRAPVLNPPVAQTTAQGGATTLAVVGSDPDGDPLTWSATGLPQGLTIAPTTGAISGTVSATAPVATSVVTVTVRDNKVPALQATASFNWTVTAGTPPNRAPLLTTPAAQSTAQSGVVNLPMTASDPDGDPLTWSATGLPQGLTIAPTTGLVSGTVSATAPVATSVVTVTVRDNKVPALQATASFNWTVTAGTPPNRAPLLTTPAAQSTAQSGVVNLPISASDPDGDPLTWSATGLPQGLTIAPTTGVVSGTVSATAPVATSVVTVTVRDNKVPALQATASFNWTVTAGTPPNRAPLLTMPAAQSTAQSGVVNLPMTGSDPDGDPLTWSATGLPAGLSIASATGVISGTVAATAPVTTSAVTVSARDNRIPALTSSVNFNWAVTSAGAPATPVNLALNRPASQSSTDWGAVARIAVDGVINGNATVGGVITHTFGNPNEWWQVDLGSAANLSSIVIWGRTDCCTDRLNGFNIMVSSSDMTGRSYSALVADPTVWKSPLVTSPITTNRSFTLPAGLTGRYVRVQMAGSNMLSMSELQVFGTAPPRAP